MNNNLPDRYSVEQRQFEGAPHKAIYRKDLGAQGNRFHVIRGMAKTAGQLRHGEHPHQTVYLDGAARGPLYDKQRGIYSLDHHEDCIRQITDPTCVQGMNLARTQIIHAVGNTIVGNDPDGDTVFAGWGLLNADLIAHDDRVFRRVQPLFIVEGNIDAYGFGYEELTGLPAEAISEARRRIKWLIEEEQDLKARGRWNTIDFVDFTEESLRKIDRYALFRDSLDIPVDMNVHEKHALRNGQSVHYVEAPHSGIYEVEYTILNHRGEKDCACIVYHDGKAKWTVKLTGYVNDMDLSPVVRALTDAETNAKTEQGIVNGEMLKTGWGGGSTIMGGPRYASGRGPFLSKDRILEVAIAALDAQVQKTGN